MIVKVKLEHSWYTIIQLSWYQFYATIWVSNIWSTHWLPGMSQSLLNLLSLAKHWCSSLVMWWVLGCISLYLGSKKNQRSGLWYCGVYPITPGVVTPSMHASLHLPLFLAYLQCIVFCCDNHTHWLLYPLVACTHRMFIALREAMAEDIDN